MSRPISAATRSVRILAVLAMVGLGVVTAPTPASATLAGFQTLPAAQGWVDFNNDKKSDWCTLTSSNRLACTVSNGPGFGPTYTSNVIDPGYSAGRAWTDVNGDGKADYCRIVGGWNKNLQCTPSTGTGFGPDFGSGALDPGWDAGRAWVDFNRDGKADYCRVAGAGYYHLECTVSTGDGFANTVVSWTIDPGWDSGRAWVDANGDGNIDYCRLVGNGAQRLRCDPGTGNGFGSSYDSGSQDAGYDAGRAWTDVNNDARADYCRVVGLFNYSLQCTLSTAGGFGQTFTSGNVDPGYDNGRTWADVNGDGKADYCREIGGSRMACSIATVNNFVGTWYLTPSPIGNSGTRGWPDHNGDGKADYCRVASPYYAYCTVSTGSAFGSTYFGYVTPV